MIPTEINGFLLLLFFLTPITRKNPIKPEVSNFVIILYMNMVTNATGMAPKNVYITTDLFCYFTWHRS